MKTLKITEEEVQYIIEALKFRPRITENAALIVKDQELIKKLTARLERKIPVVHYHFYTATTFADTNAPYDYPIAEAPCGVATYEDSSLRNPIWSAHITKVMADVTCKKCRNWLHLEPLKERPKPSIRRHRNISLEL